MGKAYRTMADMLRGYTGPPWPTKGGAIAHLDAVVAEARAEALEEAAKRWDGMPSDDYGPGGVAWRIREWAKEAKNG